MRKNMLQKIVYTTFLVLMTLSVALVAEETKKEEKKKPEFKQKFGGEAFVHWMWDFDHDADHAPSQFDFSRIELKHAVSYGDFEAQAKLEADRVNEITGASVDPNSGAISFKTDSRLKISVKRAFLTYNFLDKKLAVHAGIHDNLRIWQLPEKLWAHRYIYKSFKDQYKYGNSEGLGLGFTAKPIEMLRFDVGLINGEGRKKQQDADGRYKTTFNGELKVAGLEVQLYGDVVPKKDTVAQATFAGMLGYRLKKVFRIGAEYNFQSNHKHAEDSDLNGASVYAAGTVKILDIFARVDLFSKDTWETNETMVIAGVSLKPIKYLEFSPNIRIKVPSDENADNEVDFYINGKFKF